MRALSFRYKLLLAMMLVVGGVSVSTYLITSRQVQRSYEQIVEELVQTELRYLPQAQESRLSNVRRECKRLSTSVRLFALMAAEPTDVGALYDTASFELRSLLEGDESEETEEMEPTSGENRSLSRVEQGRRLARMRAARQSVAEVFRFLDAQGRLLEPSADTPGVKWVGQPELKAQLAQIGSRITNLVEQQVGYIQFRPDDSGQPMVLEVVVTPIIDDFEGDVVGAMIVGMPFMNYGEQEFEDVKETPSGLWLDGRLYSQTISTNAHASLGEVLMANVKPGESAPPGLSLAKDGVVHRVFYTPLNPESQLPQVNRVVLYSLGKAQEAEEELRSQILMFSGLAIVVALIISLLLSHGLSVPLHQLVDGTEEIKQGNFEVKVPVSSKDELGQLAQSFNEMTTDLALKEKYHNVLNMVTDKDVASELMKGQVTLGGEKRKISVLFCDIRGFTALTEGMDPGEVIAMLNEHMTALADVVAANKGVVDKFVGDEIMAVFGAPKSYGDDTFNAVKAGLDMIAERRRLNESSKYQISIGIGISTGEAVAGNMGSQNRLNYTVLGERVNLGARFCGVAEPGEVVIGDTTQTELGDRITVEDKDLVRLKGFTEEIKAFRVVDAKG